VYEGCARNAYHLPQAKFLKALGAEGIPASSGYTPLNQEPFLKNTLNSRGRQAIYSRERVRGWEERNRCPENDRLCEEAVWLTQNMLLGPRSDMEQIGRHCEPNRARGQGLGRCRPEARSTKMNYGPSV
jgi:hypothetical protein